MLIAAFREDICLAYANTLFWRGRDQPTETLHHFSDLLRWLESAAGVSAAGSRDIAQWSRAHPVKAANVFADAVALREAMYRSFAAQAAAEYPRPTDFALLQRALRQAPARQRLAPTDGGYAWKIARLQPLAPHLLAPILWSAGDLLIKGAHSNVRRCANSVCVWLFIDASKNATRRWCDMASCGNRAKARRHYLKVTRG
jgi:predicted RNA-binding Zn ribbon-like protein